MFSIGTLSERSGVKIPTIRYYEDIGLMPPAQRNQGNQRRYDVPALERLRFIKHARDLGFSLEATSSLIDLQDHPDWSCQTATELADTHLKDVREKIRRLQGLEHELARISKCCDGHGISGDCSILAALADHNQCAGDH